MPHQYTAKVLARFEQYVDRSGDCHLWIGHKDHTGYGRILVGRRSVAAHRAAWEIANGPIPDGLLVCHACDVRTCVRVDHLWLGTNRDNTADAIMKGRFATGDRNGARLHPDRMVRGDRHHNRLHPERMARGEHAGVVKLTDDQVREIYRRAHAGEPYATVARDFGICAANVGYIKRGQTWRHVTGLLL